MADLSGATLGKYQVIERLGRGGMAEVYRAYQPSMDRYVAVKVMHAYLADDEGFTERFKREAKSVGALRHPNIVQVIDFDMAGDVYFMVMEFIPGDTLKTLLERRGALPVAEALDIAIKLAGALTYAHHEGMLHRDIKPANVLFTKNNEPVLTDFGVARIMGSTHLTASGAIVGTPAYMSPEAGRGEQVDERTDIYSLGIVLYEMLTGAVPFDADTPYAVIYKHINDPLPMPRQYVLDLSDDVEAVLLRSLAKDKEARYQTADQFLDALTAARQNLPHQQTTAVGQKTRSAKVSDEKTMLVGQGSPARRRVWLLLAALVVLVIAGAIILGGGLLGSQNAGSTPTAIAAAPTGTPTTTTVTESATAEGTATAQPEKYAALAAQVKQQVQNAQYDDALKAVQDALSSDPKAYELLALQGFVLVQYRDDQAKLDAGKASAEAAIAIDANQPDAYIVLGWYYNFDGPVNDNDQALKYYTLAIDKGSKEPGLFILRANITRYRSGVLQADVVADYDRAVSLDPQNDQWYQERGGYYFSIGNLDKAQADLEQSLRLNPTLYKHDYLAAVYIQNKQADKAFTLYSQTIDAQKITDPGYLSDGAFIAWVSGHPDKAAEWANLALLVDPQAAKATYVQALLARDAGHFDNALALLKVVEQASSDTYEERFLNPYFDHMVTVDEARVLAAAGRIDEAIQTYATSLDSLPGWWGQPYIEGARLLRQTGHLEEARAALLKALDISRATQNDALRTETLDELKLLADAESTATLSATAAVTEESPGEPTPAATSAAP